MSNLLVGAFMISFSAVFVNLADVGPFMAGFYRTLFGGLALGVFALARGKLSLAGPRARWLAVCCGALFAMDLAFWHPSIRAIGPGLSTLLSNFQVFFLAAFGVIIHRERFTGRLLVSILVAFTGLYLIVGVDWSRLDSSYRGGIWLGLGTAVWYAAYILTLQASRSCGRPFEPTANMALISFVAAAFMALIAAGHGESFSIPNVKSLVVLAALGVVCQGAGWVLISKGITGVEAWRAGLVLLLQPMLSFVWDVLFFGRSISVSAICGAVLGLTGIYLGSLARVRD